MRVCISRFVNNNNFDDGTPGLFLGLVDRFYALEYHQLDDCPMPVYIHCKQEQILFRVQMNKNCKLYIVTQDLLDLSNGIRTPAENIVSQTSNNSTFAFKQKNDVNRIQDKKIICSEDSHMYIPDLNVYNAQVLSVTFRYSEHNLGDFSEIEYVAIHAANPSLDAALSVNPDIHPLIRFFQDLRVASKHGKKVSIKDIDQQYLLTWLVNNKCREICREFSCGITLTPKN